MRGSGSSPMPRPRCAAKPALHSDCTVKRISQDLLGGEARPRSSFLRVSWREW
jgi:hypothetical protein